LSRQGALSALGSCAGRRKRLCITASGQTVDGYRCIGLDRGMPQGAVAILDEILGEADIGYWVVKNGMGVISLVPPDEFNVLFVQTPIE
jgi:hypothetical protein